MTKTAGERVVAQALEMALVYAIEFHRDGHDSFYECPVCYARDRVNDSKLKMYHEEHCIFARGLRAALAIPSAAPLDTPQDGQQHSDRDKESKGGQR